MPPRLTPDAHRVHCTQPELFERRNAQWQGLQADIVTAVQQLPHVRARVSNFYIDPRSVLLQDGLRFGDVDFRPQLFIQDPEVWRIAGKLKNEALSGGASLSRYGEALIVLLAHELIKLNGSPVRGRAPARGGLSGWRRKRVTEFIEAHLAEEVRLATLAQLVDLSPYHFVRAFRASFGVPPHRYHVGRRIERAKALLAEPARSVTEIARALGFAETSSFSTTFRRATGCSPSGYRRDLA